MPRDAPTTLPRLAARWRGLSTFRVDAVLAVAAALAAVAALLLTPLDAGNDVTRAADALGVALIAATAIPLAWRRTAPVVAFLASFAATLAVILVGYAGTSILFTFAFALVSVAANTPRRTTLLIAALTLGVAGAGLSIAEGGDLAPIDALTLTALVLLPLLAGDLRRTERARAEAVREQLHRTEQLRKSELENAAAAERVRIARDVHDIVGHHLSAIAVQAHAGRIALAGDVEQADRSLATIVALADEALTETRQALGGVRSAAATAPQPGVAQLEELIDAARRDGLRIAHRVTGEPRAASPLVEASLYRILQEALTNVRRHGAGAADVDLRFTGEGLELDVANSFVPRPGGRGRGHGVVGMGERAALVGGRLEAGNRADGRWLVRALLPFDAGYRP